MIIKNKSILIEKLTGVHSSKKSYYVELKQKIKETTKRNTQLDIINQLAKSIGVDMSPREIVENMIPKLQTLVRFDRLGLYVVEENKLVSRGHFLADNKNSSGYTALDSPLEIPLFLPKQKELNRSIWQLLREKKPLLFQNVSHPISQLAVKEQKRYASVLLIPLLVKEKVIGVLEIAGTKPFNEDDLPFLEQVADQLAVCLENVRLYHEVWRHKQEWEITFSAVTDLLVFIDKNCEIRRLNKSAIDFFTLPEKKLLGRKCYHLFFGRDTKCNPCLADQVLQTGKTAYQQCRTRFNRVLDIFAYPAYTEKEEPYGVTYYAKDVTRFVDSIKFVSLGEMSAGVAHELNSPLTAIVGNAQLLLRETPPSDPHYQLIKDINNCGMRCQRIIQNLLTFSRQEEYTFEPVQINDVVESALSLIQYQVEKSKIKLTRRLQPDLPPILGNAHSLEQILINLLLNAKDAVEQKENAEISIATMIRPENFITVEVRDNGCGIEPGHIPHIFDPFYTTKKVGKGTGLGLSVSLGIAQSHGGIIDVESSPGEGSCFSLILPINKDNHHEDDDKETEK
ncbi:MAG TPA: ATP-binding protein [Bacillota bacterium]|jgi:two-component system NtrC family sensor kinase|nr:ATP-binding protein [Bacillota bacterium]HPT34101.1 ATP-binding protein [Bacillota bacterium]